MTREGDEMSDVETPPAPPSPEQYMEQATGRLEELHAEEAALCATMAETQAKIAAIHEERDVILAAVREAEAPPPEPPPVPYSATPPEPTPEPTLEPTP